MGDLKGVSNDAFEDIPASGNRSQGAEVGTGEAPAKDGATDEGYTPVMSKKRIMKNIIVLSLVFLINFTAYNGLSKLQSSLHRQDGMGVACQSVLYGTMVLSCLLLPKLAITYLGHKWCVTVSLLGYILWMAANGYAVWGTMITASIILGIAAATLWTPQCAYFTIVAREYGKQSGEPEQTVLTRFFGIFFCFFQLSAILGSIISSTVLTPAPDDIQEPTEDELEMCGLNDCPWNNDTNVNFEDPADSVVWTLVGIYIGIGLVGFIICAVFVDNLPPEIAGINKDESVLKIIGRDLMATVKHMKHKKQLLLIPITMYSGFEQTFYGAEWNNSYVTCAIGIWMVGWTSICGAILDALTSFFSGQLVRKTGRIPIFVFGMIVDLGYICCLLFWAPHPDDKWLFFVIPCLWGIADGIWQTQINSFYGVLFPLESEAAFSNYRLWESIGFTAAFGYSAHLCTDVKLYIVIGMLFLGMFCYGLTEAYGHKKDETGYPLEEAAETGSKRKSQVSFVYTVERL